MRYLKENVWRGNNKEATKENLYEYVTNNCVPMKFSISYRTLFGCCSIWNNNQFKVSNNPTIKIVGL